MADERDDEEELTEDESEELEDEAPEDEDADADEEDAEDEDAEDEDDGDDAEADSDEDEAPADDSDEDDSDEDDSDEDDSDEDEDEDDSDEDEEDAPRPKRRKARGKSGKRRAKQKSAAARLAAARAAKAARKAAKRGKELKDEKAPLDALSESKVAQQAAGFGDWAAQNKPTVYGIVAAIVLIAVGTVGYLQYTNTKREDAGAALSAAIEISNARIRDEDEIPDEDDPPSYTSEEARAEAALEAYDGVLANHAGTEAVAWAHLGRGQTLLALDRPAEAREAFEAAVAAGGEDASVVWRALEGKGFSYEAEENWDGAVETYEELGRIDDGRFDPVSKYHIARMYIARDQTEQATETLDNLVEELRGAENSEEEQGFAYVLAQAEVRLRELDPSLVPARPTLGGGPGGGVPGGGGLIPGGGGGAGGEPQMSPEQIQELIRRFQQQQGGGEGGGEGE